MNAAQYLLLMRMGSSSVVIVAGPFVFEAVQIHSPGAEAMQLKFGSTDHSQLHSPGAESAQAH
jgi:hypothetical protein